MFNVMFLLFSYVFSYCGPQTDSLRHHELGVVNRKGLGALKWCTTLQYLDEYNKKTISQPQETFIHRLQTFPGNFFETGYSDKGGA